MQRDDSGAGARCFGAHFRWSACGGDDEHGVRATPPAPEKAFRNLAEPCSLPNNKLARLIFRAASKTERHAAADADLVT